MEFKFKKVSDSSEVEDVAEYLKSFLIEHPGSKIIVGSDSLEYKRITVYATIIAMLYPTNDGSKIEFHKGAHLLYTKKVVKGKHVSMWERLWREVEASMEVSNYIEDFVYNNSDEKTVEIHLDINPDEQWASNKLLAASVGMLTGLGYKVEVKPDSFVASCAADMIGR